MTHEPRPFIAVASGGGVRCTCGDYERRTSTKPRRTMAWCWQGYWEHWIEAAGATVLSPDDEEFAERDGTVDYEPGDA